MNKKDYIEYLNNETKYIELMYNDCDKETKDKYINNSIKLAKITAS